MPRNRDIMRHIDAEMRATCLDAKGAYVKRQGDIARMLRSTTDCCNVTVVHVISFSLAKFAINDGFSMCFALFQ